MLTVFPRNFFKFQSDNDFHEVPFSVCPFETCAFPPPGSKFQTLLNKHKRWAGSFISTLCYKYYDIKIKSAFPRSTSNRHSSNWIFAEPPGPTLNSVTLSTDFWKTVILCCFLSRHVHSLLLKENNRTTKVKQLWTEWVWTLIPSRWWSTRFYGDVRSCPPTLHGVC